jgi:hypothetical protein
MPISSKSKSQNSFYFGEYFVWFLENQLPRLLPIQTSYPPLARMNAIELSSELSSHSKEESSIPCCNITGGYGLVADFGGGILCIVRI